MFNKFSDDFFLPLNTTSVMCLQTNLSSLLQDEYSLEDGDQNEDSDIKPFVADSGSSPSTSTYLPSLLIDPSTQTLKQRIKRKNNVKREAKSPVKQSIVQPPAICDICEGPAGGYHYGAPSCNGCKTHFRRIVVTGKKLICKKNGNCAVKSGVTARVCRSCRYDKCIQAGMDPRAIQLEDPDSNCLLQIYLERIDKKKSLSPLHKSPSPQHEDCHYLNSTLSRLQAVELMSNLLKSQKMIYHPELTYVIDLLVPVSTTTTIVSVDEVHQRYPSHMINMFRSFSNMGEYLKTFSFFCELSTTDRIEWFKEVVIACANTFLGYQSYISKSDSVMSLYSANSKFYDETPVDARNYMFKRQVALFIENEIEFTEYLLIRGIVACSYGNDKMSLKSRQLLAEEKEKLALCLFRHTVKTRGMPAAAVRFQQLLGVTTTLLTISGNHKNIMVLRQCQNPRKHAKVTEEVWFDKAYI